MRKQHSFVRLVPSSVLSFLAAFVLGCGGGRPYTGGAITIYADNASVSAGSTTQLHATQYDIAGIARDISATVTWTSSAPSIATVSTSGMLTGISAGSAMVTATLSSATGTFGVSIGAPSVTALALSSASANIYTNATQQYTAAATYANNTTANVTSSATWSVLPASVATVSASGLLTALSPGTYVITATNGGKTATISGTVSNPPLASIAIAPANPSIQAGTKQQFTATATYADGSTQNVTNSVTWTSSSPSLLAIGASGLATLSHTRTASTATITAQSGTITQTTNVSITPSATVNALIVQPTSSSVAAGTAELHTALALYSDGSQQNVTSVVTWSTSSTSVVAVGPSGMDIAIAPGTATLQASYAGLQSQSTVIVTPATITGLAITAARDLFPVGAVQQLILTGTFSDGSHQDLSLTANWHSSDPAIATIASNGVAQGVAAGDVQFTASFGGLTAHTDGFQVLPRDLISTAIQIPDPIVIRGAREQLRFIGIYADGSSHDLTTLATWSSADSTVFSIDNQGAAYGLSTGNTQVTGTALGKSATVNVSTSASTLKSIQILPNPAQFALGTTTQFNALGALSNGSLTSISDSAVWSSSDPTVFTVDSHGRVKSGKPGTATLSVTLSGITQTLAVTVTNAALTKLILSPNSAIVTTTSGHLFTARGFFSDGTLQDLTHDVLWATTDETIASIDNNGLALGMKSGQVNVNATFGSQTATAPLTITQATLLSTALIPGNTELPVSIHRQYTLLGTFSDGTTEDLAYDAIWSAPTPSIADVLANGEVLGVSPGLGSVSAQHGLFTTTTPVTVTHATLAGIALTPATATIRRYGQQQFTATGTFSDGFTQPLTLDALFRSSAPTVASIGDDALADATSIGTSTLTATFNGITASSSLQVQSDVLISIAVTPTNLALTTGNTQQLTATGTYEDGTTSDLTSQITWTSSNPAVFSIDVHGLATASPAITTTSVTVTAQLGTVNQTFTVAISPAGSGGGTTPPALVSIAVSPTSSHIAAGTTLQLTLTGTYSDGCMQNLTSAATWSSSSLTNAVVTPTGLVTGVLPGTVNVTAQLGGMQSAAVVIVSAATLQSVALSPSGASFASGSAQQFTLTGTFTDGTTQNLSTQAVWLSSNPSVATVSPTGLVTGTGTGPVAISATINGQTATTTAQITPATIVSVAVAPTSASFAKGTTQQFTATATYSDHTTHDITNAASFTTSNAGIIGITSAGLATGMGSGIAQVTVTAANQTATTHSVTITPATIASIAIYPNTLGFANGTTTQFTAIATLSDGTTQDITTQAIWTSSNPAAITVNATGLAQSGGTGTTRITASLNGTAASTGTVTVTPATLTGILIAPASAQLAKGTTRQFTATGTYTDSSTHNLTTQVTWSSSNPAVLTVDCSGLATGASVGSASLTATFQGQTITTPAVQVTPATVTTIAVLPANQTLTSGTTQQFTATAIYTDGTTQDITASVTWNSSNTNAALISSGGLALTEIPGTTIITAQSGALNGTTTLTTNLAPILITSITVAPANGALATGTTQQYTATAHYSDGSTQDVTNTATWTSTIPASATVSSTGLVTGVAVGNTMIAAQDNLIAASTALTVTATNATLTSITVTPANPSLAAGQTQQFTATANYSDGSIQNVTKFVTWNTPAATATIDTSGLATAISTGNTARSSTQSCNPSP